MLGGPQVELYIRKCITYIHTYSRMHAYIAYMYVLSNTDIVHTYILYTYIQYHKIHYTYAYADACVYMYVYQTIRIRRTKYVPEGEMVVTCTPLSPALQILTNKFGLISRLNVNVYINHHHHHYY